jgi:predicted ATPase
MRRYINGWKGAFRAFKMARAKKHGAGKSTILNAMKIAAGYRFIIDGQHRKPMRVPFYLKGVFK